MSSAAFLNFESDEVGSGADIENGFILDAHAANIFIKRLPNIPISNQLLAIWKGY